MNWNDVRDANRKNLASYAKIADGDICAIRAITPSDLVARKNKFGKTVYSLKVAIKRGDAPTIVGDCEFSAAQIDKLLENPEYFLEDNGNGWGGKFKVVKKSYPRGITVIEFEKIE